MMFPEESRRPALIEDDCDHEEIIADETPSFCPSSVPSSQVPQPKPFGCSSSSSQQLSPSTKEKDDSSRHHNDNSSSNDFFSFPCSPRELGEQKDLFLTFARILVKYLELRDRKGYETVREALRECAKERRLQRQAGILGLASVEVEGRFLLEMSWRMKQAVSAAHWNAARSYLKIFLARRRKNRQAAHEPARVVVSSDGS